MNTPKTICFLKVFTPIIYFSFFFCQDIKEQVLSTYYNGAKKEVLKVFASDDYYVELERIVYSKHGKPTFVESFFDKRTVKREYHSNRKLKREINYKDGILDGQILEYFENGQLKCSFIYDNGEIKPGTYSSYYVNGFLEDTYTLGEVKEFYDNGNLKLKAFAIDTITYKSSIKYNDFLKSFVDTTTFGLKYKGDYKKYFEDGKLKLFIENINWEQEKNYDEINKIKKQIKNRTKEIQRDIIKIVKLIVEDQLSSSELIDEFQNLSKDMLSNKLLNEINNLMDVPQDLDIKKINKLLDKYSFIVDQFKEQVDVFIKMSNSKGIDYDIESSLMAISDIAEDLTERLLKADKTRWYKDLINMENVRIFNETGNLIYDFQIYQSLYHDEYKAFFDNGQKKIMGQYSKGLKTGLWLEFDDEGSVVVEENWNDGIRIE